MELNLVSPVLKDVLRDTKAVDVRLEELVGRVNGRLASSSLTTLKAGGKRLRPLLLMLGGTVGEYRKEQLLSGAVAVELIHMASLVHDDVLDAARVRRGKPTVFSLWGPDVAVATGDFLFAEAFELLARLENQRIMELGAATALALSVGELQEQKSIGRMDPSVPAYFDMVANKTAKLFSASCELGGVIAGASADELEGLAAYGKYLGVAFQIYDDLLDFSGDAEVLGKPVGNDLRQGNLTLPIIYALEDSAERERLFEIVSNDKTSDGEILEALAIIERTDAIDRGRREAREYVGKAIEGAKAVKKELVRESLVEIGNFAVRRYH